MAYAQSAITRAPLTYGGREYLLLTFTETEVGTTSQFTVPGLPQVFTILSYKATKTSGAGSTLNPKLGSVTAFTVSTQGHIATNTTTAAHINDQTKVACTLAADPGILYGRNAPDSGSDNAVSTEILIAPWVD